MGANTTAARERAQLLAEIAELEAIQLRLRREELQSSLREFAFEFWDIIEPDQELKWNWHLDEIEEELIELRDGVNDQLVLSVPPGTMKSLLCSVLLRAWLWSSNPSLRFLAGSYGSHLSIRDNVKLRNIVTSDRYRRYFPEFAIVGDAGAKERFDTTAGGWSIATSVGGIGTGEHPDFVIVDDAITEQQSRSEVERAAANNWIDRTLSTRGIARKVRTLVIGQRLHIEDPPGHLVDKGWRYIAFPMEYEVERAATDVDPGYKPHPRDRRTKPGELLWPELIPADKLRQVKLALGPFGVASQLQQQPGKEEGGLFSRSWFQVVDRPPGHVSRRVRGWDDAGTEGGGCYTCGVRIAEYDVAAGESVFVVEDVIREQIGPDAVEELILNTAKLDGRKDCVVREEKEGGSAGLAVIASRVRKLVGFDYQGVSVTGDKVTRAKPFRTQCEGRRVYLLRAPWNEAYLAELAAFPNGKYKDQVDASATAFNTLLLEPKKRRNLTW